MGAQMKRGSFLCRLLLRVLLVIITLAVLMGAGSWILLNQIMTGPSPAARDALTLSLLDSDTTSWIPGLFLEDGLVDQIRQAAQAGIPGETTDPALITVQADPSLWEDCPGGIALKHYRRDGLSAHILLVRDPSLAYLSYAQEGAQIGSQMASEGAAAGIYAARDGDGLLISRGSHLSSGAAQGGFVGFTKDHILILSGSMTPEEAQTLDIRDGCGCGMILILNGQIHEGAYNAGSGFAARACIGQRADGTVVFLTIDGLSAAGVGGTYRDCIDILYEYGCVNACCLNDVPAAMLFGDRMIHADSLPRAESAVMPCFWMIRSGEEG